MVDREVTVDYSSRPAVLLRRAGRRIGVLRPLQRTYRRWTGRPPEATFDRALRDRVNRGDTVWDVGAHVGAYTRRFADLVGDAGCVVALEPSPTVLPELTAAVRDRGNVVVIDAALSDATGIAAFYGTDDGPTSFHGLSADGSDHALRRDGVVRTERGDTIATDHPPNLVKIDVEGFELEVLNGMGSVLLGPGLHTVALEMHFQTLARRGLDDAPRRIVELLEEAGLVVRWTDPSHLVATRPDR